MINREKWILTVQLASAFRSLSAIHESDLESEHGYTADDIQDVVAQLYVELGTASTVRARHMIDFALLLQDCAKEIESK